MTRAPHQPVRSSESDCESGSGRAGGCTLSEPKEPECHPDGAPNSDSAWVTSLGLVDDRGLWSGACRRVLPEGAGPDRSAVPSGPACAWPPQVLRRVAAGASAHHDPSLARQLIAQTAWRLYRSTWTRISFLNCVQHATCTANGCNEQRTPHNSVRGCARNSIKRCTMQLVDSHVRHSFLDHQSRDHRNGCATPPRVCGCAARALAMGRTSLKSMVPLLGSEMPTCVCACV